MERRTRHVYGHEVGYIVDDDHIPPVRTKHTHPYSYDPILQFNDRSVVANQTIYSDRLVQWDRAKYEQLAERHFGKNVRDAFMYAPAKIEAFLRDWVGNANLKLATVHEECNQATGYPLWRFDFYVPKEES